ncbi:MAG TPA: DUF3052 domain-containing protein [Acidimicrobiales bacterium]|jgi:hypothetical protein|nr:DUF3052 domain-containing protein [Acidimicrobiales bacterium]
MAESYAATPLHVKLGINETMTLALLHSPADVALELPAGVQVRRRARGRADVVLAFFSQSIVLERQIDVLGTMIFPSGGLWIAWPKRSSKLPTDITDHGVRDVALPLGLVDNKVCAIDETWTALRVVWRRSRRGQLDEGPTGAGE